MGGESTETGALHILGLAARLGGAMLLGELVEWDILAMGISWEGKREENGVGGVHTNRTARLWFKRL